MLANLTITDRPLHEVIAAGDEVPIDVKAVTKLPAFARNGRPANVHLVYRLMKRGTNGVTLEWARVPGGVCTTREAVSRFVAKLNEPGRQQRQPVSSCTPRRQAMAARRAHENAMKSLAAAGLA